MKMIRYVLLSALFIATPAVSQQITAAGQPAQLDVRVAGERSIRITLKPLSYSSNFPATPTLAERSYAAPVISLRQVTSPVSRRVGNLNVQVRPNPLTVVVTSVSGQPVQRIVFENDGNLSF